MDDQDFGYITKLTQKKTCRGHLLKPRGSMSAKVPLSYRRARFTPPGAKYLILDDLHFHIDPQIINYNGLSFHTSMGLPEYIFERFAFSHLHRKIN